MFNRVAAKIANSIRLRNGMRPYPLLVGEVLGAVVLLEELLLEELELLLLLLLEGTLVVLVGVALTMLDWELEEDPVLVGIALIVFDEEGLLLVETLDEVMLEASVLVEELLDVVDGDEVVEAST